jgi:hypothetical protein
MAWDRALAFARSPVVRVGASTHAARPVKERLNCCLYLDREPPGDRQAIETIVSR